MQTHCRQESVCIVCKLYTLAFYKYNYYTILCFWMCVYNYVYIHIIYNLYAFCVSVLGSTYNIYTMLYFKLQCLSLACSWLWMTCLICLVASANSEGINFTGMFMELLHKLSFVKKGQLQALLNSHLFHNQCYNTGCCIRVVCGP